MRKELGGKGQKTSENPEKDKENIEFDESINLAENKGIKVAWSNDAFELWVLLHFEKAEKKNVIIYTIWDEDYPLLLKKIYDPPVLLYTIGQPLKKEEDAVAIVGTR